MNLSDKGRKIVGKNSETKSRLTRGFLSQGKEDFMKYKDFLTDVFRFPFHKKKFVFLISAYLLMVGLTALAANGNIQQTEAAEAKQLIKQAEKLTRRGEFIEAEKILRGVVERSPENSAAKLALGYNLLKTRRFVY